MTSPPNDLNGMVQWARDTGRMDIEPKVSARCRVCRDEVIRGLVNKMISKGFTNPDILEVLSSHNVKLRGEGRPEITTDSITNHRQQHFDIQTPASAIYRRIQEKRAAEQGQDWQEGVGSILNVISYYETMMLRGYENLTDPDTTVSYLDGGTAAAKLHELSRKDEDAYERARLLADMGRIIEVVRSFVPSDQWPAVQAALRGERVTETSSSQTKSIQMVDIDDSDAETS